MRFNHITLHHVTLADYVQLRSNGGDLKYERKGREISKCKWSRNTYNQIKVQCSKVQCSAVIGRQDKGCNAECK